MSFGAPGGERRGLALGGSQRLFQSAPQALVLGFQFFDLSFQASDFSASAATRQINRFCFHHNAVSCRRDQAAKQIRHNIEPRLAFLQPGPRKLQAHCFSS
jgi:hypothetical protein